MPKPSGKHFEIDPSTFTIGAELATRLGDLIETARTDLKPQNFAERHLVDDLALAKWRTFRVNLMEKAIFEREATSFKPRALKTDTGDLVEPHEDMYHFAMAHAPERHATVLAALGRLETRYARQFCTALRLLLALRRGTPPPVPQAKSTTAKTSPAATTNSTRKEVTPCEPSLITQPTM